MHLHAQVSFTLKSDVKGVNDITPELTTLKYKLKNKIPSNQSKTLSSSVSSNMIHFSVCSSPFNHFYFIFYYLTSKHSAPSSGMKSQLIFINL